jgi:hypothetical protein
MQFSARSASGTTAVPANQGDDSYTPTTGHHSESRGGRSGPENETARAVERYAQLVPWADIVITTQEVRSSSKTRSSHRLRRDENSLRRPRTIRSAASHKDKALKESRERRSDHLDERVKAVSFAGLKTLKILRIALPQAGYGRTTPSRRAMLQSVFRRGPDRQ